MDDSVFLPYQSLVLAAWVDPLSYRHAPVTGFCRISSLQVFVGNADLWIS